MWIVFFLTAITFFVGMPVLNTPSETDVNYAYHENATDLSRASSLITNQNKLVFNGKEQTIGKQPFAMTGDIALKLLNVEEQKDDFNYQINVIKDGRETEIFFYRHNTYNFSETDRPNRTKGKIITSDFLQNTLILSGGVDDLNDDKIELNVAKGDIVIITFNGFYDFEYTGPQIIDSSRKHDSGIIFGNPNITICQKGCN